MSTVLDPANVTFDLKEVASIVGIDSQDLRNWVAGGIITPVVRGGDGRGNTHRFSINQLVGLGIGCAWRKSPRGCLLELLGAEVQRYEGWSLSAIQGLLRVLPDEFTEEGFRKQMPRSPIAPVYDLVPAQFEDTKAIFVVLMRLKKVVLEKLSAGGRISHKRKK